MHIRAALLSAAVAGFAVVHHAAAQAATPTPAAMPAADSAAMTPAAAAAAAAAARPARAPRARRDLITAEQAHATSSRNAYEVIERLHPVWLHKHGPGSDDPTRAGGVSVFVDGHDMGGVNALKDIPSDQVASIQYYEPIAASSLFGPGHDIGVIAVSSH